LRAQIWDPTARNPNTVMPPFGRHRILSEDEIDLIVDYIHTL
jgi:sulfur-oxidizing protein SoxX